MFNYNVHQTNKTNQMNDGVAIAIKRNIKYTLIDNFDEEFLAIKLKTTQGDIIIATAYLPPRRPYLPAQDLLRLVNYTIPVYIIGDLNARHRIFGNNDNNNVGNALCNIINTGKLIHIGPHFGTFIGRRQTSTPDIIFTNNKAFHNYYIKRGPLTGSDHLPIIMQISTSPIQIKTRNRLNMAKADWDKYTNILRPLPLIDLQGEIIEQIDEEIDKIHNEIKRAVKESIPIKKYRTLPYNKTTETLRRIQTQFVNIINNAERRGVTPFINARIHMLQYTLHEEYRQINHEMWNEIITTLDSKTPMNMKEFWEAINRLKGNEKEQTIPYLIDQNGVKLYENEEKEIAFRRQWSKVFKITDEENEHFDSIHEDIIKEWMEERVDRITPDHIIDKSNLRTVGRITIEELYHTIRKFKEKTPGLTGITKNMILYTPENIKLILIEIYNSSMAAGYFPDNLKIGKLIFIPKQGKDNKRIENYRPITLLEITGKILEKIINNKLLKYLEDNHLINDRQYGFRKNRSTSSAIALITEAIAQKTANREQVNIIQRDVSKAFDKIWHLGLKYKILQLGLPHPLEKILCDYITDRTAKISIGDHLGPEFDLLSGVPQGGCLSPTLYILYTSDTPPPTPYSEYVMYADDITQIVAYPGKSREIMARKTSTAIENINEYEKKWKIKTNNNKFKIIPLAKKLTAPIIVNGEIIPYANECNMLGLKITRSGYSKFMKEKTGRTKQLITKLKRFRNLKHSNKKLLYLSLVRPVLEYPPVPTHALNKTSIKTMQTIQNLALKDIYNIKYPTLITSETLHLRANIPPINVLLHRRAEDTWNKIEANQDETLQNWINQNERQEHFTHSWFPSSKKSLRRGEPQPIYK